MPGITEEDVRRAYYATAGAPLTWWITELQMDPPQLIVAAEDTGKLYRVPYAIEGAAIDFGGAAEIASYSEVAAGRADGPVVVYASAAESRGDAVAAWGDDDAAAWDDGEALYAELYPADEYPGPGVQAAADGGPPAQVPSHGPVSVQHSHEHSDYNGGGTHVHTHRHRADARHEPGRDHLHPALPDVPGVAAGGPLAAGIAAARAAQLASDPAGPAGWSEDRLYRELFGP
jgi:hypothetical protein